MKNRNFLPVLILLLVPFIYLVALWPSLPERLPVHFTVAGAVDRYGTKQDVAVLIASLSLVGLVIYAVLSNLHRLSRLMPVENKGRMQKIAFAVFLFMTVVQCWMLYTLPKGTPEESIKFVVAGACLLFALIGNYMPNLKPNYFAGFRLPWTLNNETNWRKTHHVAGSVWFAGGLAGMALCLLLPLKSALVVTGSLLFVLLLIPAIYSYRLFRQTK